MASANVTVVEAANNSDAQAGRLFATLSYVVPFFLILPLVQRTNAFALYHAKQALTLFAAALAAGIALTIVLMVVPVAIVGTLLSLAMAAVCIGGMIFGALAAWGLKEQPLPLIGARGAELLKGLTVNQTQ